MSNNQTPLPIDEYLPAILAALKSHNNLVVSAAPGAGKTTRVPVALSRIAEKQVWVLEPRRIAAISSALRISEENNWSLGQEVGYQVRFEKKATQNTKILFLTEALLLRKLKSNPDLNDVSMVVIDEFHERSIHVDLALAALKELQLLARPDLKIIVMSATLDALSLSSYLQGAPLIDVPGKLFPLQIIYEDKAQMLRTGPDFTDRMSRLVVKAFKQNPQGDLLCFLPGRGEIDWIRQKLNELLPHEVDIHPLHGQMSIDEQRAVVRDSQGRRKIILATNIAESSLTIDGVRIVVDSGLARILDQDSRTGFEALTLTKISKASATQRAGRSARQAPGVVYRAWTKHEESSQREFEIPEILRVDLAESLLLLAGLGIRNFEKFSWFTAPPARRLRASLDFLISLGALDESLQITPMGEQMCLMPVPPRWGKLLLIGRQKKQSLWACELAAVLTELRQFRRQNFSAQENDVLSAWQEWKSHPHQYSIVGKMVEQLTSLSGLREEPFAANKMTESQKEVALQEMLFEIYKDRLCRRRQEMSKEGKMVGGRGVQLHPQSSVKNSEYFLAIEVSEGSDAAHSTVYSAVGLSEDIIVRGLGASLKSVSKVEWDSSAQKFWTTEGKEWLGLMIGSIHRRPATSDEVSDQLLLLLIDRWDQILQKNKDLAAWWARLIFLNLQKPQYPILTKEQIALALELAAYGEKTLEFAENKNLVIYFQQQLSTDHLQQLEKECPTHWIVPTGNRFQIQYSAEQGPSVEVRLQELFGLNSVPSIAGQPLTLFLLAPNFRPVQVTRDLPSFWKNGYPDVRKEMRPRYPKHSWPEDPLTALPQAKGRPRR